MIQTKTASQLLTRLALCGVLLGVGHAQATLTPITSRSAFLTALGASSYTDTFDNLPSGQLGSNLGRGTSSAGYTATSSGDLWGLASGADGWLSTYTANRPIELTGFGAGVFGVGANFFGTDINGQVVTSDGQSNVTVTVTAYDGESVRSNLIVPLDAQGFLGFVSSTRDITRVRIAIQFTSEVYLTINNLVIGQDPQAGEVPEPATLALVAAALGLLGLARRGKKA